MDQALRDRFNATVKVRRVSGNSDSGNSVTLGATITTLSVYLETEHKLVSDGANGVSFEPLHTIIIDANDYTPTDLDRWFLPGVDATVDANGFKWRGPVLAPLPDQDGLPSHWEVML